MRENFKDQVKYFINKPPFENKLKFSNDIEKEVYGSGSVSYVMLQFAIYMGFKKIYLIGFDHSFAKQKVGNVVEINDFDDHFKGYNIKNVNIVEVDKLTEGL